MRKTTKEKNKRKNSLPERRENSSLQAARTSIPGLRFPEFRDKGKWKEAEVREIATVVAGQSPRGEFYNDTCDGTPFYQGKTGFGEIFINPPTKWTTRVTKLAIEGDILMSVRAPVGALNVSTQELCIGRGLAALRAKEDKWFLYYLLLHFNRLFVGNGGSVFDSISKSQIVDTLIPLPPTTAEQQKIVECLSSLDGLIAAEVRMLEAIKVHKKGFMQQLFPQPGQTQPRLRFPEFDDKGEWEQNTLSVIAENLDNKRVPIKESDRIKGNVPYYGASGIVDYVRDYLFDEDLLCISEDGANLVARTYPIAFPISGKTWVNNHAHVLRFDKPATQKMVEEYLNSTDLRDFITGMAQPKLNRTMLNTISIPLPEQEEQQKIAACLTALDDRIAAQAAKIKTIEQHKRGLMQQLFPAPEDN